MATAPTKFATGEQYVNSKDGTSIFIKSYNVENPKAQLLVVHGFLEHCLRYDEFAQAMCYSGISVTLFDYRGHGKSSGDRAYCDNWNSYSEDLEAAMSTLLPNKDVPTFVLGHSNGGCIVMNYLLDNPQICKDKFQGVLLSSPFFAPADQLGWVKKAVAKTVGYYFPSLRLPADLKVEKLTSDKEKQKEHDEDSVNLADFSAGWAFQGMATQEKIQKAILEDSVEVEVPIFFAYSTADQVADGTKNGEIADALKASDKTVLPMEGEHEILNEVKREDLYEKVSQWILSKK